jgi:hypothetical protein
MKMVVGFMLAGAALSVWMFFGQLFSSRAPSSSEILDARVRLAAVSKSDLYLVEFVGVRLPAIGDASAISSELPEEIDLAFVGSAAAGMKIVGLVPAGSRVSVTGGTKTVNTPLELRGIVEGFDGEVDLSFVQEYSAEKPALSARLFSPLQE